MEKMGNQDPKSAYIVEATIEELRALVERADLALQNARHGQDVLIPVTDRIQFYVKGTVSLDRYNSMRHVLEEKVRKHNLGAAGAGGIEEPLTLTGSSVETGTMAAVSSKEHPMMQ